MAPMGLSQLELGTHAIGARHQQRLAHALRQAAEPTKTAQTTQHLRPARGLHTRANALHEGAPGLHINAGCAVVHPSNHSRIP